MKIFKGSRRLFDTIEKETSDSTYNFRHISIIGISNISDLKDTVLQVQSYSDASNTLDNADTTFYIKNNKGNIIYTETIALPVNWVSKGQVYNIHITEDLNIKIFGANIGKSSSSSSGSMPIGTGMDYYGAVPPENYMFADGSQLAIVDYPELFAVIGYQYSAKDSGNYFNLPDKRSRISVMKDEGTFNYLGKMGGEESHVLTVNELATHTHTQNSHSHTFTGTASSGSGNLTRGGQLVAATMVADGGQDRKYRLQGETGLCTNTDYYNVSVSITPKGSNSSTTAVNQNTGGSIAHNNLQPYLVCNYIIKVK